jgi:tetratricopeptide (TPR) repeat protein
MKRISIATLTVLATLLIFSCATAPEEAPEEKEAEPTEKAVEEPEVPAPDAKRDEAENLKRLVEKYEFQEYAEDEYSSAEEAYTAAEDAYGSDNETAASKYEEAIESYNEVIRLGVTALYDQWQAEAKTTVEKAEEIKTSRAVPEKYKKAEKKLEEARAAYKNENFKESSTLYWEGIEILWDAIEEAEVKRERAMKALEQTETTIQETEKRLQEMEQDMESFDSEAEELEGGQNNGGES